MAPEIVSRQSYNKSVDIWSLGCIIHEMVHGKTPFSAKTSIDTYQNILISPYIPPVYISKSLTHLLQLMLSKKPEDRPNAFEITEFKWFESIEWNKVDKGELNPPKHLCLNGKRKWKPKEGEIEDVFSCHPTIGNSATDDTTDYPDF